MKRIVFRINMRKRIDQMINSIFASTVLYRRQLFSCLTSHIFYRWQNMQWHTRTTQFSAWCTVDTDAFYVVAIKNVYHIVKKRQEYYFRRRWFDVILHPVSRSFQNHIWSAPLNDRYPSLTPSYCAVGNTTQCRPSTQHYAGCIPKPN